MKNNVLVLFSPVCYEVSEGLVLSQMFRCRRPFHTLKGVSKTISPTLIPQMISFPPIYRNFYYQDFISLCRIPTSCIS